MQYLKVISAELLKSLRKIHVEGISSLTSSEYEDGFAILLKFASEGAVERRQRRFFIRVPQVDKSLSDGHSGHGERSFDRLLIDARERRRNQFCYP